MGTDDVLPEGTALVVSDMYEKLAEMRKKVDFMELSLAGMWVLQVVIVVQVAMLSWE
jgi:hypothetical protein